jgi:hypothetical protein
VVPFLTVVAAPRYTIWAIEESGPTFVKFAQWAANRNDLFPEEWTTRLRVLQDETTPHPWTHTEACLTREFGPGWEKHLSLEVEVPSLGNAGGEGGGISVILVGWAGHRLRVHRSGVQGPGSPPPPPPPAGTSSVLTVARGDRRGSRTARGRRWP